MNPAPISFSEEQGFVKASVSLSPASNLGKAWLFTNVIKPRIIQWRSERYLGLNAAGWSGTFLEKTVVFTF